MKYLFESIEEQQRIPLSEVTWDIVKPVIEDDITNRYQQKTINLPNDFMSSSVIKNEWEFDQWFKKFVKRWGADGELVQTRPLYWDIKGNPKWDKAAKIGSDEISGYYSEKGSGGYTGD